MREVGRMMDGTKATNKDTRNLGESVYELIINIE